MAKPMVFYMKGFDVIGVLHKTEKIPQKCVAKAAGKGANVVRKAVRSGSPVLTGDMKRGIVRTGERNRTKGKKVYQVTFSSSMNDTFQRTIKNPGEAGGKRDHAYYPASMEYGFLTRSKGGGLSYVPGYHFMQRAAEASNIPAKTAMVAALNEAIDKEWSKK